MSYDLSAAEDRAREYLGTSAPLRRLGWGISGAVFLSHDLRTAVKVLHYQERYEAEVRAYRILAQHRLFRLHGLTIPKPRGRDDRLRAVQMDIVDPPYLLDFAGVEFRPPDFSPDVMDQWRQNLDEMYGPNVSVAYSVYESLKRLGMYYLDFRHSNMRLDGLPGLAVEERPADDDGDPERY